MRRDSAPAWAQVLVPGVLLAVIMGPTLTDSVRFDRILTRQDTRTLAQRWVEANLPEYSTVVTDQYGPVLNPSQRQLLGITGTDTTAVRSWASHKSRLNALRYELLKDRRPQFEVVELPAVRAALAYPGIEAALRQHPEAGYLVLSSKHVGCPDDLVTCVRGALPTDEWHLEPLQSIVAEDDVPALDNPGALTFHNPSIVVFRVSPRSQAAVPTLAP
jgi:hypothetical protein